ncbi:sugar transferase [Bacteriovoracaceae bacterium]|nr:sugar transferase [Bacteriovoracaceae bacterium]
MKRVFDFLLSLILLILFTPLMVIVFIMVKLTSKGPALFWSQRVGIDNKLFSMPKFRTMKIETPQVATHLLEDSVNYKTSIGDFLRKTSLDELPQLISILTGKMSFVGPRPALFNQEDLIALRTQKNIHLVMPGLTGWAQINGRDEISINEKVELDFEYTKKRSFFFDMKIMYLTFLKVVAKENVSH